MSTRGLVALLMATLWTTTAAAAYLEPPLHKPDWWKVPGDAPDGVTRTLYRSFVTDPTSPDDNGDYTYNGFTPSIADGWTDNLPVGHACPAGPRPPEYGDGIGLCLDTPHWDRSYLDIRPGNRSDPTMVKEYFIQIVRDATLGPTPQLSWIAVPDNSHIPVYSYGDFLDEVDLDNDTVPELHVHTWTGVITGSQPAWEHFWIEAYMIDVDSMWIGTHCVPEPGTIALVTGGIGVLGYLRRRR